MSNSDSDVDAEYVVESIVGKKWSGRILHYKVRWKHYPPSSDTWEPIEHLKHCPEKIRKYEEKHGRISPELSSTATHQQSHLDGEESDTGSSTKSGATLQELSAGKVLGNRLKSQKEEHLQKVEEYAKIVAAKRGANAVRRVKTLEEVERSQKVEKSKKKKLKKRKSGEDEKDYRKQRKLGREKRISSEEEESDRDSLKDFIVSDNEEDESFPKVKRRLKKLKSCSELDSDYEDLKGYLADTPVEDSDYINSDNESPERKKLKMEEKRRKKKRYEASTSKKSSSEDDDVFTSDEDISDLNDRQRKKTKLSGGKRSEKHVSPKRTPPPEIESEDERPRPGKSSAVAQGKARPDTAAGQRKVTSKIPEISEDERSSEDVATVVRRNSELQRSRPNTGLGRRSPVPRRPVISSDEDQSPRRRHSTPEVKMVSKARPDTAAGQKDDSAGQSTSVRKGNSEQKVASTGNSSEQKQRPDTAAGMRKPVNVIQMVSSDEEDRRRDHGGGNFDDPMDDSPAGSGCVPEKAKTVTPTKEVFVYTTDEEQQAQNDQARSSSRSPTPVPSPKKKPQKSQTAHKSVVQPSKKRPKTSAEIRPQKAASPVKPLQRSREDDDQSPLIPRAAKSVVITKKRPLTAGSKRDPVTVIIGGPVVQPLQKRPKTPGGRKPLVERLEEMDLNSSEKQKDGGKKRPGTGCGNRDAGKGATKSMQKQRLASSDEEDGLPESRPVSGREKFEREKADLRSEAYEPRSPEIPSPKMLPPFVAGKSKKSNAASSIASSSSSNTSSSSKPSTGNVRSQRPGSRAGVRSSTQRKTSASNMGTFDLFMKGGYKKLQATFRPPTRYGSRLPKKPLNLEIPAYVPSEKRIAHQPAGSVRPPDAPPPDLPGIISPSSSSVAVVASSFPVGLSNFDSVPMDESESQILEVDTAQEICTCCPRTTSGHPKKSVSFNVDQKSEESASHGGFTPEKFTPDIRKKIKSALKKSQKQQPEVVAAVSSPVEPEVLSDSSDDITAEELLFATFGHLPRSTPPMDPVSGAKRKVVTFSKKVTVVDFVGFLVEFEGIDGPQLVSYRCINEYYLLEFVKYLEKTFGHRAPPYFVTLGRAV